MEIMLLDNEIIFTSYCFMNSAQQGDYYAQQIRLKESILKLYPEANLHFLHEDEETGKPKFQKSLYGYKVGLIKDCLDKGFKKIIYFDSAICLEKKVDYWFDIIHKYGVLSAVDRQFLSNCTSSYTRKAMGLNDDVLDTWHLTGGSIYVFDFNLPQCQSIYDTWAKMEQDGLFGTQEQCTNGLLGNHRMDETCMAISLYLNNSEPLGHDIMKYCYEHPETKKIHGNLNTAICCKRHFK